LLLEISNSVGLGMLCGYECINNLWVWLCVGAMGGEMGIAWWNVIGYHTTYPYPFSFPQIYATCFNAYPIL